MLGMRCTPACCWRRCAAVRRGIVGARSGPGLAPQMDFVPNAAGTYQLQRIQQCPDAVLLNASAGARRLSAYTRGKVTLLTFFYTYCTDPWGCPFAYQTMKALRDRIAADASSRSRVRFVSISFDPITRHARCIA